MAVQPGDPEAMQLFQIIGAPLLAVVQAEVQAAQVSADFIKRVGFVSPPAPGAAVEMQAAGVTPEPHGEKDQEPVKAGEDKALHDGGPMGNLKMAEFAIERTDAAGNTQPYTVKIPVLSLFPIPLLQIKDAEFDYNVRVLTRVPLQSSDKEDVQTGHVPSKDYLAPDRVELKGLLAPNATPGERSSSMSIKVKIRMEQADIPAGLTKLLSVMDQNVSAVPAPRKPDRAG